MNEQTPLASGQEHNQPLVESRPDEAAELLRQRFAEFGYLFFRGFVEPEACAELQSAMLSCLQGHVEDGEQGPALIGEPFFETDPVWDAVYPAIQSLESLHGFFHQPRLQQLMQQVVNDEVFVYPMKMARISTPRKLGYETPPHQDAHSHQAPDTMAGIWIALHDIDQELGRLKLLPGSHQAGVRRVLEAQGVGGVQCEIFPEETTWHTADFGRGDVVIFHACTVHKAEPNRSDNGVRLSVDTRFSDYGAPVFVTNFEPHHGWRIDALDWQAIYRGWTSANLQYYWQDYPNVVDQVWRRPPEQQPAQI